MVKYQRLVDIYVIYQPLVSCVSRYGNLWQCFYKHYKMLLIEMVVTMHYSDGAAKWVY